MIFYELGQNCLSKEQNTEKVVMQNRKRSVPGSASKTDGHWCPESSQEGGPERDLIIKHFL